jgi:2-dehydro-3-deoxyphosphogluconate aldolase/(4S)-4-hydroxy-2-oxoglutarate aldolase
MARFSRIQVALETKRTGIVPVFYHSDVEICKEVLLACYSGGVRVFEFTNRGDFAHEIFAELVKYSAKELPDMILGIGSVLDPATAALYIQSGTNFIVAPILNQEVAKVCNRRKIAWMPGCGSVTEISQAEEWGAEVVKIFPGSQVGGPGFVKGVLAPMPWTSIMPTGGVDPTEESLKTWFGAGVHCVGMGSKLISKDVIANSDYATLEERCRTAIAFVQSIRK